MEFYYSVMFFEREYGEVACAFSLMEDSKENNCGMFNQKSINVYGGAKV